MPPIKIACAGYPVGQQKYQSLLNAVELIQMFDTLPKPTTVERWKSEAKAGFEFITCAPDDITHPHKEAGPRAHRYGYFQDTNEVQHAYRNAVSVATALNARTMFFRLARTTGPNADQIQRIHNFFQKVDRAGLHFVWEAPASWPATLVATVSKALRIVPVVNPLEDHKPVPAPLRYFRLGSGGKTAGVHRFSNEELSKLKRLASVGPSYVVFNNGPYAYEDAVRFASLIY